MLVKNTGLPSGQKALFVALTLALLGLTACFDDTSNRQPGTSGAGFVPVVSVSYTQTITASESAGPTNQAPVRSLPTSADSFPHPTVSRTPSLTTASGKTETKGVTVILAEPCPQGPPVCQ